MKRIKQLFLTAVLSLTAVTGMQAQQPLNGCWHPDDVIKWSPDNLDRFPDNKFNVAKVPLAQRFKEPTLMKANANQRYEGEICNSTILYPTCSMCPSQGELDNFLGYQPTYWQYMDKLVYWAGAASEGIINIPPAASTDAAHAQGVKVLGNVFFPPAAFGGTQAWVRQMLTVEGGRYVYAIKLFEMCKYFGFDGWFINEESGGGSTAEWEGFFKEFYRAAQADGKDWYELQWYNASRTPNTTLLKTHINTSQFLEYGAVGDHRGDASSIGCTAAQTFSKIYAGVELARAGHLGWTSELNSAMPTTGHVGSLDLFCPETKIWEDPAKAAFKSSSRNHGSTAYPIGKTVFENDEDMWVNSASDPTQNVSGFPGVSNRILERSAITQMPFLSDMGVGNGKHRFVEGVKRGTRDWYHSGMQSILPTWRWWIENKGNLTVGIDWDNAYNVGSSFKFSGTLSAGNHLVRLYKTKVAVTAGGTFRVVYKGSGATVEAKLSTTSSTTPDVTLSATTTTKNGWTIADFDLSSLNGKTIYMLAINLKAAAQVANFNWNLGQVALLPTQTTAPIEVSNLETTSSLGESKGDIRLTWEYDWTNAFDHFDIYTVTPGGARTLVGQTRDQAFYIPTFQRNGTDAFVKVDVVPVMKDGRQLQASELQVDYPKPEPPKVMLELSKSYILVGQTATITAKGTGNPTGWQWTLPAGLQLESGYTLTSNPIKVKGVSEGKQTVTIKATNSVGTSTTAMETIDVMATQADLNQVYNVVRGKTVVDYSGSTNSTEVPARIIDGVTNPSQTNQKWCNVSADNWVVFDCEGAYRIYGFKIYDGNAGPESGVDQIDNYIIQLSSDGKNWTTVVDKEGQDKVTIKEDYIAPVKARYVKLIPHVNGTLRIWEFEVFGRDDNNMTISVQPEELKINSGETKNITVSYNLNGDTRATDFKCTVTAAEQNVTIGRITENTSAGTFTVPVTGGKVIGTDKLTINVDNGGAYKERTVDVIIDSQTQPNVLSGITGKLRKYNSNYSYEATYSEYAAAALTDGNKTEEACLAIEDPSIYKDDVWAIFTAPTADGWNLSKVKIYLPNNNQGENDNGREGSVNKEISIRVGNDLSSLQTVVTFSDLGEVGQLEYIFPEFKNCKYLAIVCNLNAYFYASLAEVEAFEQFDDAIPAIGPVSVASGWNADVVVEALTAANHSNETLDNQGWCLVTTDVKQNGGLPVDGYLVVNDGIPFQFADYTQNNAVVMKTKNNDYEVVFEKPVKADHFYLLSISAEGSSTLVVNANYTDGTTKQQSYTIGDWWSGTKNQGEAYYGLDRIKRLAGGGYTADKLDGRTQFRLFNQVLETDRTKPVRSLTLRNNGNGIATVLAIAKRGVKADETTGIILDESNNPSSFISHPSSRMAIYSPGGQRLSTLQPGINIIRYSNGTVRKILVK